MHLRTFFFDSRTVDLRTPCCITKIYNSSLCQQHTPIMRFNFLSLLLFLLIPFAITAPTPTKPQDIAGHPHPHPVQARQAAATTGAPPQPAQPAQPAPAAPSTAASSDSQLVTTIVQAVWPDVDPLIQEAVIYVASGIPSMISSLLSSWGL